MAERTCNDCGAAIVDQRYLKCGGCLRRIGVVALTSPVPPSIDWKEAAHHYRHRLKLADQHALDLKRRLWHEHEKRITFVNTVSDVLSQLAPVALDERCRVCHKHTGFVDHAADCWYLRLLEAVAEAGRSVED